MENKIILVVEDNNRLRRFVCSNLTKAGYTTFEADSKESALKILKEAFLDLVLLDLRLGDQDGIEILKIIRTQDEYLPVIIVSSINTQEVKLDGFSIGCDDYITKPFYMEEVISRIKRLLKRTNNQIGKNSIIEEKITMGPFVLNVGSLKITKNGNLIVMRKKLFDLFLFFLRHPNIVLSNQILFQQAWENWSDINENSLYVHIRELRNLIEDNPSSPRYIKTVRNAGYKFTVEG